MKPLLNRVNILLTRQLIYRVDIVLLVVYYSRNEPTCQNTSSDWMRDGQVCPLHRGELADLPVYISAIVDEPVGQDTPSASQTPL